MMATCWLADCQLTKALAARRGHLGQVDRHAAQLHPGRKALQQAAQQHQQGRSQPMLA
jgi:hypothetical protein